jgi:hypothetical protein
LKPPLSICKQGRCGVLFFVHPLSFSVWAEPDKTNLRGLLESGKFAELDAEMSAYQAAYRASTSGDEEASKAFMIIFLLGVLGLIRHRRKAKAALISPSSSDRERETPPTHPRS